MAWYLNNAFNQLMLRDQLTRLIVITNYIGLNSYENFHAP